MLFILTNTNRLYSLFGTHKLCRNFTRNLHNPLFKTNRTLMYQPSNFFNEEIYQPSKVSTSSYHLSVSPGVRKWYVHKTCIQMSMLWWWLLKRHASSYVCLRLPNQQVTVLIGPYKRKGSPWKMAAQPSLALLRCSAFFPCARWSLNYRRRLGINKAP